MTSITVDQATETIYTLYDAWAPPGGTPVKYAMGEGHNPTGLDEYVRLSVQYSDSGQHTLGIPGARRYERRGILVGSIYTKLDRGAGRAVQLGESFQNTYEGTTVDGVWFQDGIFRIIGPRDGKLLSTVTVTFQHEETK